MKNAQKTRNKFYSIQKYTKIHTHTKYHYYRSNSLENIKERKKQIFITSLLSVEYWIYLRVSVYLFEISYYLNSAKKTTYFIANWDRVEEKEIHRRHRHRRRCGCSLPSQWLSIKTCFKSYPNLYMYTLTSIWLTTFVYSRCVLLSAANKIGLRRLNSRHSRRCCCYILLCNRNKQWITFYWLCHCHFQYDRKSQSTSLLTGNKLSHSLRYVCSLLVHMHAIYRLLNVNRSVHYN